MMVPVNDAVEAPDKQRIGPILWREKYVIVAAVVVMIALAFVYTATTSKVYQASAILQVNVATNQPGSVDTTNANQGLAQNYATLLVSPGLLDTIRSKVEGGHLSAATLQSRLTATALPTSALVQLTANGPSPNAARNLAQQVVDGFLGQLQTSAATRTAQLQNQGEQSIRTLSAKIAQLQTQPVTPATTQEIASLKTQLTALNNQTEALVASGLAQGTSVTLAAPPVAATDPISPRRSLNLIAGLLLGLVLGVGLAWLRHQLRPAIRSSEEAHNLTDLPVLASIPLKPKVQADDPTIAEAYRILSTQLSFAMRHEDLRLVTVVGYNPQVGKTSVVMGLADAYARGDRKVLLVDGDMRAAALSSRLGQRQRPGLVDLLQGAIPLETALVKLRSGVTLLPARPSKINAASLLSGGAMSSLTAELRERFDLVLFDSPPIAGLADGLILASHSDLVVLVARTGLTTPTDLTLAATSLTQAYTPIGGLVVFEEVTIAPYYPIQPDGKPFPKVPARLR